jgi:hypothetical protein
MRTRVCFSYMRDLFHDVDFSLPGLPVVPLSDGLLAGVLLPGADIPVTAHDTECALRDPTARKQDRLLDGGKRATVALRLRAALETKPAEQVFSTCSAMTEPRDIVDIRR